MQFMFVGRINMVYLAGNYEGVDPQSYQTFIPHVMGKLACT